MQYPESMETMLKDLKLQLRHHPNLTAAIDTVARVSYYYGFTDGVRESGEATFKSLDELITQANETYEKEKEN